MFVCVAIYLTTVLSKTNIDSYFWSKITGKILILKYKTNIYFSAEFLNAKDVALDYTMSD